jgi:hypothetical protein
MSRLHANAALPVEVRNVVAAPPMIRFVSAAPTGVAAVMWRTWT